ncbi:MAG TPA: Rieske (2Fe-2S) protein [Planctomycetota bacterium]|nr:Rieske (2Fe-2S) protein [Planctomycetota bacterium]
MKIDDPEHVSLPPSGNAREAQPAWREQFPIDWPNDEFRSRRDFTKMLGLTSLAFVAGQVWIGVLSVMRKTSAAPPRMDLGLLDELPVGGAKRFDFPSPKHPCVLVRLEKDRVVAFGQKCTHLSCPVIPNVAQGKFLCPCHHGAFDIHSGRPLAGPPRRALPKVVLEVKDGRIYAIGFEENQA